MFYKVLAALDIIKINKHEFWICSFVEFTIQIIAACELNFSDGQGRRWLESLHWIFDSCQVRLLLDLTEIAEARWLRCGTALAEIFDREGLFNEHNCLGILAARLRLDESDKLIAGEGVKCWKLTVARNGKIDSHRKRDGINRWKIIRVRGREATKHERWKLKIFAIASGGVGWMVWNSKQRSLRVEKLNFTSFNHHVINAVFPPKSTTSSSPSEQFCQLLALRNLNIWLFEGEGESRSSNMIQFDLSLEPSNNRASQLFKVSAKSSN